jgi:type I restriction enzyme S subunit
VTDRIVKSSLIPLPPLDEQRRITAILDKADALRRKRKRAIELLGGLSNSAFISMFGDPAENPNRYPMQTFREISLKISDGPFGSNLKSEHYVEQGVRVIRLQNIGVGSFIDGDKAFISSDHFNTLSRHECLPGDVLVGTLGDPNLRACLQPQWLDRALNKADCVQIRADPNKCVAEYIVDLINQPSTERMAQGLILGQTRSRISMGRLKDLKLPIAPLSEQRRFAQLVQPLHRLQAKADAELAVLDRLFLSLQQRAFSGQL